MKKLLFVCTGNICRSPMAEAMWRHLTRGRPEFAALSAGVSAAPGQRASAHALDVLREHGIDAMAHRSQPVTPSLVREADVIVAMTSSHAEALAYLFPDSTPKVFLLREFDPSADEHDLDVPDPIGLSRAVYAETRDAVQKALPGLLAFAEGRAPAPRIGAAFRSYLLAMTQQSYAPALADVDPDIFRAIEEEARRQDENLELIASENFTSPAVREAQGSVLTNKYAEGYPGRRWYGGCEHVDVVEQLALDRARELFPGAEHVNVQPHSGAQANMAVYFSVLKPGDRILTMDLSHGGHLTHGHRANFSGKFYEVTHYGVRQDTEVIDYDALEKQAQETKPRMITVGASAYSRTIDFARMRAIADACGALLFADMAHIAGLVAGGQHPSPVGLADFTTTTTHKSLRGPRGGLIFCKAAHAKAIDAQVFPGVQGGPLMHVIAAKAVCLREALQPAFRDYAAQVVRNAKAMSASLSKHGWRIVSGGTDNHLLLVDLRPQGLDGKWAQETLDRAGITVNKNSIPFDTTPIMKGGGIRVGTPAVTTRGMREEDMMEIADLMHAGLSSQGDEAALAKVRQGVRALTRQFPVP